MNKIVLTGIEARQKLALGAKKLSDAVSRTLGPFGENAFLEKGNKITNDGVTIAREIQLKDEVENRGAWALREAAIKTNDEAGDGTTTAITLAWAIYEKCSRLLAHEGIIAKQRPAELVSQIEKERKEITEKLIAMATPIETKEQLINSAIVAVEDKELGELIGTAQWELGKDGYLLAEETNDRTSSYEKISGVRIDNGVGTSQVLNNQEKQTCEVEDTHVLLTTITIKDGNDWNKLAKVAEAMLRNGKTRLVIIARAWSEQAIALCLRNLNSDTAVKIYPFSAPYIDMQERMKDLAAVLGAKFYDSENSLLEDIEFSGLGYAKRVVGRRYDAILTGSDDILSKDRITKRIQEIQDKLNGSESEFEKKLLRERIAQLQNGFALIKVGASSDMERKRLFDKCEDAVNAVRAAFQEGTVKGGGLAFKEIADSLPDEYLLKQPLKSINEQIMSSAPSDFVIEEWVRDPVKVLRIALERACSAASSFATAGIVICDEHPKDLNEIFQKFAKQE